MIVDLVLEGVLEEPVARKIVNYCGHEVGNCFGKTGVVFIRNKAYKYHDITKTNRAVFVLTDFSDAGCSCPIEARNKYLYSRIPQPSELYHLRFAVAELESWLLADCTGISQYLLVDKKMIPSSPDNESDPKQVLVNLARKSRKGSIKKAMVPYQGHGGVVGPLYVSTMCEFVEHFWDIRSAATSSPSLERCIHRLSMLI